MKTYCMEETGKKFYYEMVIVDKDAGKLRDYDEYVDTCELCQKVYSSVADIMNNHGIDDYKDMYDSVFGRGDKSYKDTDEYIGNYNRWFNEMMGVHSYIYGVDRKRKRIVHVLDYWLVDGDPVGYWNFKVEFLPL